VGCSVGLGMLKVAQRRSLMGRAVAVPLITLITIKFRVRIIRKAKRPKKSFAVYPAGV